MNLTHTHTHTHRAENILLCALARTESLLFIATHSRGSCGPLGEVLGLPTSVCVSHDSETWCLYSGGGNAAAV